MTLLRRGTDYREVTRVEEVGKCFQTQIGEKSGRGEVEFIIKYREMTTSRFLRKTQYLLSYW